MAARAELVLKDSNLLLCKSLEVEVVMEVVEVVMEVEVVTGGVRRTFSWCYEPGQPGPA